MDMKLVLGGAAVIGLISVGAYASMKPRPAPAPVDNTLSGRFVRNCSQSITDKQANAICKCMVRSLDGTLNNEQEYELAVAIVKAYGITAPNKTVVQATAKTLEKDFQKKVSSYRRADILPIVSKEALYCGGLHGS